MGFKGKRLGTQELLNYALNDPEPDWAKLYGATELSNTAADAARGVRELKKLGEPDLWRHGIVQALDYYISAKRRGRVELAEQVFTHEVPPLVGVDVIDAGFAALAQYLANRDGWKAPDWIDDPARTNSTEFFVFDDPWFRREARLNAPEEFRSRNLIIHPRSLSRA